VFEESLQRSFTYESINRLQTSLHGLVHGFSGDNAWGLQLNSLTLVRFDGAMAINGFTEWVKNTSEESFTDGDIDDGTSSLDDIAFLNFSVEKHVR
jgi:hypothetical protein